MFITDIDIQLQEKHGAQCEKEVIGKEKRR